MWTLYARVDRGMWSEWSKTFSYHVGVSLVIDTVAPYWVMRARLREMFRDMRRFVGTRRISNLQYEWRFEEFN